VDAISARNAGFSTQSDASANLSEPARHGSFAQALRLDKSKASSPKPASGGKATWSDFL
jgi:hypothetical protein